MCFQFIPNKQPNEKANYTNEELKFNGGFKQFFADFRNFKYKYKKFL